MLAMMRTMAGEWPTLVDHAEAYAELAAHELAQAARQWSMHLAARAACALSAALAVLFGGIALMLWGALPDVDEGRASWLLWAVPLGFALISAAMAWHVRGLPHAQAFAELRSQWRQDMALVRSVSAP